MPDRELKSHPYRVLVVEDEMDNWAKPMGDALQREAKTRGLTSFQFEYAITGRQARMRMANGHFHLTSLDMRLPEDVQETVSVEVGTNLAKAFPFVGFPKPIVFSITLEQDYFKINPDETFSVLQLALIDKYAKDTGTGQASRFGVPCLSAMRWAERVLDYLATDTLTLAADPKIKTVVGAYLDQGPSLLPPVLARQAQLLANHWDQRDATRNDAAIRFIEATVRLAMAQSLVLLGEDGWPDDNKMSICIDRLNTLRPRLSGWNWFNYLSAEAISAFREALKFRNEERHTLAPGKPAELWKHLRPLLQYAMDVAAYWVRHPLCSDLRYTRDGWTVEPLAGTASPRRRGLLPEQLDFPAEAVRSGSVWQNVWTLDDEPQARALDWSRWVELDDAHCWIPITCGPRAEKLDLVSGETRRA